MNEASPLVSVVIPFLNPGRFFAEAIESALAQTWPHWELLLVNDGSTDGSADLARSYAGRSGGRIVCLEHEGGENKGSSASRNLGIDRAKGEYLAFLDADDIWLPEKLERQVALLKKYPEAGMVYGSALVWYSWDNTREHRISDWRRSLGVEPDSLVDPPRLVELYLRGQAETPGTCSVLMRRRQVEEVGGFESDFPGMYDDQVLFYKFCLHYPVYIESGCWDRYRQHPESCCHAAARSGFYDPRTPNRAHRIFLKWVNQYLKQNGIADLALHAALAEAEWPYSHPVAHWWRLVIRKWTKRLRRAARLIFARKGRGRDCLTA